jgi:integrase
VLGPDGVVAPAEAYLAFLHDLGRSWHTVRGYASDLAIYFDYLDRRSLAWDGVGLAEIAAFSAHLRGTNRARPMPNLVLLPSAGPARSPASVQRALTAVYGLYDFHTDTRLGDIVSKSRQRRQAVRHRGRSPHQAVAVKVPKRIRPSLTPEELATVLRAPERMRDRLLLAFMGLNGLRVGAALGLRHQDVSLRRGEVRVVPREDNVNQARAKRRSDLVLPLHAHVGRLYARYLDEEYGHWDSDYVFINLWAGEIGAPMNYDTARALIARVSKATEIPFTAHVLRHTFATLLRREGVEMEAVSELLGHSSVDVTRETYVHTTVEDLRRHLDRVEAARAQR